MTDKPTSQQSLSSTGSVTFVGAGPGDPELITLKAQRLIAEADVIIYAGSLVNPAILAHARPDVERHDSAGMKLDEQVRVMREAAAKGQSVVRLHTGDPAIYGAISEQMRQLDAAGIPYRIVPGVSSAFAAAAALGIEYTIPDSTQTIILTRLAGRTPVPDRESLDKLAAHHSSLVIFLSAGMLARVVEELIGAGYSEDTPVAVVFRASWPDELIVRGTLSDIAAKVEAAEITHHALIVVSPALRADLVETAPDSHLYGTAFDKADGRSTTAIISLTRNGTATGQKLLADLPDSVLYAPERFINPSQDGVIPYTESVRQVLQSAFEQHQALICIMAAGIVVRDLAPLLRSKHSDPGVVVVDEAGRHAISLLGGHKGGANALAQRVAQILGGDPVLTTASDVQGLPAVDLLGREWGWTIRQQKNLTALSAALVNGDPVGVFQEVGETSWLPDPLPSHLTVYPSLEALQAAAPTAAMVITHRTLAIDGSAVIYRPLCLVIGVGCNRGTPAEEISEAIEQTLKEAELSPDSLLTLATIEDKADEAGLLEVCERCGWPLKVFTREEIATITNVPNPSEWAQKALGVIGVAEPAAMLGAGTDRLLVEKRKFENVTVAAAMRQTL